MTRNELLELIETAVFAGIRTQKRLSEVEDILEMLVSLGQAVSVEDGKYAVG